MSRTVHERYWVVEQARLELSDFYLKLLERADLTFLEAAYIVNSLTTRTIEMGIKSEREE